MDHKNLLTIGNLSELSGVHVKALRYYDRIGILPPTWVNEENGYRYYSQEHIYLVEIIKLCAEISIPLKELKNYLSKDGSIENISELADIGIDMLKKRIEEFQEGLTVLEGLKGEIQRSSAIKESDRDVILNAEPADYWLEPYEGKIGDITYHQLSTKLFERIEEQGLVAEYEMGIAYIPKEKGYGSYIFIKVEKSEKNNAFPEIIHIPAMSYQVRLTTEKTLTSANKVFPELFKLDYQKIIFQLEFLEVQMDRSRHRYEIRCSLPEKL